MADWRCRPYGPTRRDPPATVAKKPGHRGERAISRKPLRRECRNVRRTCTTCVRMHLPFARKAAGAFRHPAFPAPSVFRGSMMMMHHSGIWCRGNALPRLLRCHAPRKRGIQYSRGLSIELCRLWNTGSPAFAGDDSYRFNFQTAKTHARFLAARSARVLENDVPQ